MAKRRVPRYRREAEQAAKEKRREDQARESHAGRSRIQADLTKQAPNNSYGVGRLYYEDLPFACRDCGKEEIWTAKQQQWWYEVAKGSIYTTAVRCRACRRARKGGQPRPPAEAKEA